MTEKGQHTIKHKNIKLLDDRIVLDTKEILTSDIKSFDVTSNDSIIYLVYLGLSPLLIALENEYNNNLICLILCIIFLVAWPFGLAFGIPEDLAKKYLHISLNDGTFETINPLEFKSFVAQLQVIWENHHSTELKKLYDWANKETENLDESLTELKDNNKKDLTKDLNLTKWNNQYILDTLKLRSFFI